MAELTVCFLVFAALLQSARMHGIYECFQKPLQHFDLNSMLNCGHNGESWSIWSIPGKHPYCAQDTMDRTRDGRYQCYQNGNRDCRRVPYIYNPRDGWSSPNQLSRDLGNGSWSQSLVLDTDNCNFLVQLECYEDGSVHTYVTYKSTWPRQERQAYLDKARWLPQLSFLQYYMLDCENGYV